MTMEQSQTFDHWLWSHLNQIGEFPTETTEDVHGLCEFVWHQAQAAERARGLQIVGQMIAKATPKDTDSKDIHRVAEVVILACNEIANAITHLSLE